MDVDRLDYVNAVRSQLRPRRDSLGGIQRVVWDLLTSVGPASVPLIDYLNRKDPSVLEFISWQTRFEKNMEMQKRRGSTSSKPQRDGSSKSFQQQLSTSLPPNLAASPTGSPNIANQETAITECSSSVSPQVRLDTFSIPSPKPHRGMDLHKQAEDCAGITPEASGPHPLIEPETTADNLDASTISRKPTPGTGVPPGPVTVDNTATAPGYRIIKMAPLTIATKPQKFSKKGGDKKKRSKSNALANVGQSRPKKTIVPKMKRPNKSPVVYRLVRRVEGSERYALPELKDILLEKLPSKGSYTLSDIPDGLVIIEERTEKEVPHVFREGFRLFFSTYEVLPDGSNTDHLGYYWCRLCELHTPRKGDIQNHVAKHDRETTVSCATFGCPCSENMTSVHLRAVKRHIVLVKRRGMTQKSPASLSAMVENSNTPGPSRLSGPQISSCSK